MKTKFTNVYTIFCCLAILLSTVSCENEQLNLNDDLLLESESSSAKKTPEFAECNEVAAEVKLIAGQFTEVGKVTVEEVGNNYKITYTITEDGYCISETHLSVVKAIGDFPLSGGGNPKNGNFEYSGSHDCESSVEYLVPIVDGPFIAAHAVVNCTPSTPEAFEANLPGSIVEDDVCVKAKPGTDSYFDIEIKSGDLTGNYGAWCVDFDSTLLNGQCFGANIFTIYDELTDPVWDNKFPDNFGAVNWILNEDLSAYTYGEIQYAIWKLIEGIEKNVNTDFLGEYDVDKALEIYNAAILHLDFEPECGQLLGVILIPTTNKQSVIIGIPIDCVDCEETAWGAANGEGCEFPGNNWATYFKYGTDTEKTEPTK